MTDLREKFIEVAKKKEVLLQQAAQAEQARKAALCKHILKTSVADQLEALIQEQIDLDQALLACTPENVIQARELQKAPLLHEAKEQMRAVSGLGGMGRYKNELYVEGIPLFGAKDITTAHADIQDAFKALHLACEAVDVRIEFVTGANFGEIKIILDEPYQDSSDILIYNPPQLPGISSSSDIETSLNCYDNLPPAMALTDLMMTVAAEGSEGKTRNSLWFSQEELSTSVANFDQILVQKGTPLILGESDWKVRLGIVAVSNSEKKGDFVCLIEDQITKKLLAVSNDVLPSNLILELKEQGITYVSRGKDTALKEINNFVYGITTRRIQAAHGEIDFDKDLDLYPALMCLVPLKGKVLPAGSTPGSMLTQQLDFSNPAVFMNVSKKTPASTSVAPANKGSTPTI